MGFNHWNSIITDRPCIYSSLLPSSLLCYCCCINLVLARREGAIITAAVAAVGAVGAVGAVAAVEVAVGAVAEVVVEAAAEAATERVKCKEGFISF